MNQLFNNCDRWKLNKNNQTQEANAQQIKYSEYLLLKRYQIIQSLDVAASSPQLRLKISLTYLHERNFCIFFYRDLYYLSKQQNCILPITVSIIPSENE